MTEKYDIHSKTWSMVYDRAYAHNGQNTLNSFLVWADSYTNQPMPLEEMNSWLNSTVKLIKRNRYEHVFEIGCGNGLILFKLLSEAKLYDCCDISKITVDNINQFIQTNCDNLNCRITAEHMAAHEIQAFERNRYDTIILNSVAQYFADADYLEGVIAAGIKALNNGGSFFLGDIRNADTADEFYFKKYLVKYKKDARTCDPNEVEEFIRKQKRIEKEVLISPRFFLDIAEKYPQIASIELLLKSTNDSNEMSLFRYDVILHAGNTTQPDLKYIRCDCRSLNNDIQQIHRLLKDNDAVIIQGVANREVYSLFAQLHQQADEYSGFYLHDLLTEYSADYYMYNLYTDESYKGLSSLVVSKMEIQDTSVLV